MKKFWGLLFVYVAVSFQVLTADELVWTGIINSDGTPIDVTALVKGERYYVKVSGTLSEGIWHVNKKSLQNDACYEFNAQVDEKGNPKALPIFSTEPSIPLCDGKYNPDHIYKGAEFVASGPTLRMWIFDTDYRDNSGALIAEIYKLPSESSPGGATLGTVAQPELPAGGFYLVLKSFWPKVPDLSKETKPAEKAGDPPVQLKPSEWLAKQTIVTVEWAPSDNVILYVPADWKSFLNDRSKLVKALKLAAPVEMEITLKEGTPSVKLAGAALYEVDSTFGSKAEFETAFPPPPPPTEEGQKVKPQVVFLIDAKTGIWSSDEVQEIGHFASKYGPLEEGWADARKQENLTFFTDLLKTLGCFVATAVYQSFDAPQLLVLRAFRDKVLLSSPEGVRLVQYYYQHGPDWARNLGDHPYLKRFLRPALSAVAYGLEQLNLDSPATQNTFHTVVGWVEWAVSPWTTPDEQNDSQVYPIMP